MELISAEKNPGLSWSENDVAARDLNLSSFPPSHSPAA
jgi:hypothetical protein